MKLSLPVPLTIVLQLAALTSADVVPCTESSTDQFFFRWDKNNEPVIKTCGWLQGTTTPENFCKRKQSAEKDGTLYLSPGEVCRVTCDTCPTASPSASPSASPTVSPSGDPSSNPTASPTSSPSISPTSNPTTSPTSSPTGTPSSNPSSTPTGSPTAYPTGIPSSSPTAVPTPVPTPCTESSTDQFFFRWDTNDEPVIKTCGWLQGKTTPENICKRKQSAEKDGTLYLSPGEVCRVTCDTCPTASPSASPSASPTYCIDSPSFLRWAKTWKACSDITETDCNFEKVYTHCPVQCDKCDNGDLVCADSTGKFKDGKKTRSCADLLKLKPRGLKRLCRRSRILQTCRDTCEWCPDTAAPSNSPTSAPTATPSITPTSTPSATPSSKPSISIAPTPKPTKSGKRRALYK